MKQNSDDQKNKFKNLSLMDKTVFVNLSGWSTASPKSDPSWYDTMALCKPYPK